MKIRDIARLLSKIYGAYLLYNTAGYLIAVITYNNGRHK